VDGEAGRTLRWVPYSLPASGRSWWGTTPAISSANGGGRISVTLLPDPLGVAIRRDPASSIGDVVASEWNKYVIASAPDRLKLLVRWLKVEAAYMAHRGGLSEWFAGLEPRLSGHSAK